MANGIFNPTIGESVAYKFYSSDWIYTSVIIPEIAVGGNGEHLNFTSSDDFSISVWCYWDSSATGTYGRVYSKCGASNTYIQYMLYKNTGGNISFRTRIGIDDQVDTNSTTVIEDDTWYHCLITHEASSGTIKLYINGALEISSTSHTIVDQGYESLVVGGQYGTAESPDNLTLGSRWSGGIDELAFWNITLPADAIKQIYNEGNVLDLTLSNFYYTSTHAAALIGWYRMGDEKEHFQLGAGLNGGGELKGSAYDQSNSAHNGMIYDIAHNTGTVLRSIVRSWVDSAWVEDYTEAGIGFNPNSGMFNSNELTGLNSRISLKILDYTDPEGDGPQVKEYNGLYVGLNRMNGFIDKAHMEKYNVPTESGYSWSDYNAAGYNTTAGHYHPSLHGYSPALLNDHLKERDEYLGTGDDYFYRTWGHFSWGPFNDLSPLDFIKIGFIETDNGSYRFQIQPRFEEDGDTPRIASYLNPGKYLIAMRFEEAPSPVIIMDELHSNTHWNVQDQIVDEGYGRVGARILRQPPDKYLYGEGYAVGVPGTWMWKEADSRSWWWNGPANPDDEELLIASNYTKKYITTSIPLWTALGFDAVLDENGDVQRDSLLDKWFSTRIYMNFDEPHWNVNIYSKVSASEACTIGALYGMGGDVDVQDRITAQAGLMVTANAVTENDSYFRVMEGVISEFNDKIRVGGTLEIGKGIKTGNLNQNSESFRINYNEDDDSLDFTFFQE